MRCALLTAILLALSAAVAVADFTGNVIEVADGDTTTTLRDSQDQAKVRFDEIDAVEKGQPFGDSAKQAAFFTCFGWVVTLVEKQTDHYSRIINALEVGGQKLKLHMHGSGRAW